MNEEIIKLAKDCGYWSGETVEMNDIGIESFYKAAFNAGLEAAEMVMKHDCDCGVPCDCYSPTTAKYQIRAMKDKP